MSPALSSIESIVMVTDDHFFCGGGAGGRVLPGSLPGYRGPHGPLILEVI